MTRHVYRFDDIEWHAPAGKGTDPAAAEAAAALGVGRKYLAQGDGGFYTQVVRFPPGFEAPVHSHDHSEVFMVLEGSCRFDGAPMQRFDSTVVEANQPYGFVAGPDGLSVLVTRQGEAAFHETKAEPTEGEAEPESTSVSETKAEPTDGEETSNL
jgi:quercetin dioxygenase-like cupin family protein